MLVRRDALIAAGGLDPIHGARIDDVALGRLLKRPASAARIWLGFTTGVRRPAAVSAAGHPLDIDRAQRLHAAAVSPVAARGTLAGLLWLYLLPRWPPCRARPVPRRAAPLGLPGARAGRLGGHRRQR